MKWKISSLCVLLVIGACQVYSQAGEVPMADGMRAEGKIYVVVAIVLLIAAGLISYLFALDRKISNLEKRVR